MLRALIAAFLSVTFTLAPASAQDWPSHTINVIVPLGAGSASDILARVVMEQVGKQLGQAAVVENRPGAGGTIGANMVAKAAPDGYTLLVYGALASAHALHDRLPYDSVNDLIPVASLGQQILVVISSPGKGYNTLGDLIAAAKAKPGALNYSRAGPRSPSHTGAERLRASVGFEAQHIPFKGAAEAVTDVIAGRSDFSVQLTATTVPQIREGMLVPLAVSAHKRIDLLPDVPTTIESGLSAESVYAFYTGMYLPAKAPPESVKKRHNETAKSCQEPVGKARPAMLGVEPLPLNQAEFAKFV